MKKSASITATVAAGASESPFFVDFKLEQQFCQKTCVTSVPVFAPSFSLLAVNTVGTSQYELNVNVQGVITYYPCGSCRSISVPINQNFIIPVQSATAVTVAGTTISAGAVTNSMIQNGCKHCSSRFQSTAPLTIAITT